MRIYNPDQFIDFSFSNLKPLFKFIFHNAASYHMYYNIYNIDNPKDLQFWVSLQHDITFTYEFVFFHKALTQYGLILKLMANPIKYQYQV